MILQNVCQKQGRKGCSYVTFVLLCTTRHFKKLPVKKLPSKNRVMAIIMEVIVHAGCEQKSGDFSCGKSRIIISGGPSRFFEC